LTEIDRWLRCETVTATLVPPHPTDDPPASSVSRQSHPRTLWKVIAIVAGILGAVLAVATPLLPVRQEQASFTWPQHRIAVGVTAPLVSYSPVRVHATIPCAAAAALAPHGGTVLSTVPAASGVASHYGLTAQVMPAAGGSRLQVVLRDITLLDTPVARLPHGCDITVSSDSASSTLTVAGQAGADGGHPVTLSGDLRPQVVGMFTDLTGPAPAGLSARVLIDSRFTTSPTPFKLAALIGALLATALALYALHRLDCGDGRRNRRILPRRWWRPRLVDAAVVAVLVVWYFIGAGTSDDGYIFGMARTAGHAGYLANYFAYFGVPETPIGIPYDNLFELLSRFSTASIVVRLPELIFGIACWLLISREVLPRLGAGARAERGAVWAGGLVFLAFWLPYNNGLRPEPAVALGVMLTWVSMERALATRRLLPAALALIPAALAVVANPSGLICFGALLAGARPLAQIIVARARTSGYLALIAPAAAAGLVILTVVFAGQPFSEVSAMRRAHSVVGPDMPWYDEYLVYQDLFQPTPDGSLARRFAMLMMFLALAIGVVALLRRGGRIPGLAAGPTRRIVGTTAAAVALMMFSPTKFTHHLGVFAGLGGAVAVVAAVATAARSARDRALLAAAVCGVLALAFASSNGWWYVAGYRISWWDKPISVHGVAAGTALLALMLLLVLLAGWFHIREPFRRAEQAPRRNRVPLLAVAAGLVVAFELASFAKAAVQQYPAYSVAKSNFAALAGNRCGMAADVLVETDPNADLLRPLSGSPATALDAGGNDGFTPNGLNLNDLTPDGTPSSGASVGHSLGSAGTTTKSGNEGSGGTGPGARPGVNGSVIPLPYGLDPATTPMLGSYNSPGATKTLTSGWYRLPAPDASGSRGEILAIAAAGRIASTDIDNLAAPGQSVQLEYGAAGAGGGARALGRITPDDVSGLQPTWRDLRVPLRRLPAKADVVRIVAAVDSADPLQWVALTPPRAPRLRTLDAVVGHTTPVLLDWLVGLQFPCQQPLLHRDGVAEVPRYRITPEFAPTIMTSNWESHAGGGPLGYTQLLTRVEVMPSYLRDDWKRDWGEIERLVPLDPTATPVQLDVATMTRSARWTPGPLNFGVR
jgi:arabinosyltransferase C